MEFKKLDKKEEGRFITRYDITYETVDHQEKVYEMITRQKDMDSFEKLHNDKSDAVVIICTDETGEKILIDKEFRLAVGDWVYNFPAGLIDPGENPETAAVRELAEETGLTLYSIEDYIGPSYSAVGFSNEVNVCIVGRAKGEFAESTSTVEEIIPGWYTKSQVRKMLNSGVRFAARTQAYCYMWSKI